MVAMKYFPVFISTITICFIGAVAQNRTADLLITNQTAVHSPIKKTINQIQLLKLV